MIFLAALGCASKADTAVTLGFSGESIGPGEKALLPTACNDTPIPKLLKGWRFRTLSFGGWKTWYGNLSNTGAPPYAYQQSVPEYDQNLLPGKCQGVPVDYNGSLEAGQDGTPFDPQLLLKLGTCNSPPAFPDAQPVRCSEIPELRKTPGYYANRCLTDPLGAGGDNSWGFVAGFAGETQIQSAIPATPFVLNVTQVRWDPRSLGGPQYMMALAMAQEYLHVDMRFLQSVGGKETMFGFVEAGNEAAGSISEWRRYNRDDDQAFGPWEVQGPTFGKVVQAYPAFFAKYGPCAAAAADVAQAQSCADGDWNNAAAFYMRTPGLTPTRTGPDSPQLAGATVTSALTFYWLFDALIRSTDLCFDDMIEHGKDKRAALAALLLGYNQGPNSGFEAPFRDRSLRDDADASRKFRADSIDYLASIFRLMDVFAAAAKKSTACGGGNSIYDEPLSLKDVLRFFFGGGDTPGTPEAQGDGGLLIHFDLSREQRILIDADLRCAFDELKGKAPSTLGKDAISYRYDWLTLLRAVKSRLPLERPMPVHDEFNRWVASRSVNPVTCGGAVRDEVFPALAVDCPGPGAAVPVTRMMVSASDDIRMAKAEWTRDPAWSVWIPMEKNTSGKYVLAAAGDLSGHPPVDSPWQRPGPLWLRATDECGNATVQKLDVSAAAIICQAPPRQMPPPRVHLYASIPNEPNSMGISSPAPGPGPVAFIPVNSQGEAMPGSADGKCGSCFAGERGAFVGPVFHIETPGPVDYEFKIFTNLGEAVVEGSGRIKPEDLPSLKNPDASAAMPYDARIVWTGRTRNGGNAGTGAYIVLARFRFPNDFAVETKADGPVFHQTEKLIFGMIRR